MEKNKIYDFEIIDNGCDFEGIARVDNKVVFIPETINGEKVQAKVIKVNKSFCVAKLEYINKKSENRQDNFCEVANKCGGCTAQHIKYEYQLELKEKNVENVMKKMNLEYKEVENITGMGNPYYYRNKVQYPVRLNSNNEAKIGFYSKRSHNIIENHCCYIQNRVIDLLAKEIFEKLVEQGFTAYNEEKLQGDIKNIIIRRGYHTKEIMIILVVNRKDLFSNKSLENVLQKIVDSNENIKSVVLNLNAENTNKIQGDEEKLLIGEKYITDEIGKHKFHISSKSFFQVNTIQTELLYHILLEKLDLKGNEILFDLYSGVGSIGIFLSDSAKQVYGIEIEEQAVEMANLNIQINNVTNAEYIAGSVEDKIVEFKNRKIQPDVIVIDPPRKGLDEKTIEYILEFNPKKIGYVSCNPATLARDLKLLELKYNIESISPVDMFPHTSHVECVVVLKCR